MLKLCTCLFLAASLGTGLSGCAMTRESPAPVALAGAPEIPAETTHVAADTQKIGELERQLAREQRLCVADKRRLEVALKDAQKQNEELQKKIDALLNIDRDLRNRNRGR
jgi:hypothetical protein